MATQQGCWVFPSQQNQLWRNQRGCKEWIPGFTTRERVKLCGRDKGCLKRWAWVFQSVEDRVKVTGIWRCEEGSFQVPLAMMPCGFNISLGVPSSRNATDIDSHGLKWCVKHIPLLWAVDCQEQVSLQYDVETSALFLICTAPWLRMKQIHTWGVSVWWSGCSGHTHWDCVPKAIALRSKHVRRQGSFSRDWISSCDGKLEVTWTTLVSFSQVHAAAKLLCTPTVWSPPPC